MRKANRRSGTGTRNSGMRSREWAPLGDMRMTPRHDMRMTLAANEPDASPWRVAPLSELVAMLLDAGGPHVGRPRIIAVDGRSGSGKTTLAERVRTAVPGAEVVHTDDTEEVMAPIVAPERRPLSARISGLRRRPGRLSSCCSRASATRGDPAPRQRPRVRALEWIRPSSRRWRPDAPADSTTTPAHRWPSRSSRG
jgi:hypothetical protein